ncbi:hypothetical protein HHK36_022290 [Tetracentron sinense]|uniref:Protein kinase domain-containing protein n=1 Tax=Tetracentron sinense TaxID=13715 RepID=A0A834YRP1_TETSI|nr:hypothetical protein HHK36_022290 [Tetracentron sinense]
MLPNYFEFGLSISIPLGKTYVVEDVVRESAGVIAPKSISTRRYTEKSDVYSFGMLLFEILIGRTVFDGIKNGVRMYLSSIRNREKLMAFGELAFRCVKINPEERPSMMEAAKERRRIRRLQHDSL